VLDSLHKMKMTAKEKAQDLLDKMYYSNRYIDGENYSPQQAWFRAKSCVLVLVDEIIQQATDDAEIGYINYWNNVKKELESK